MNAKITGIGGIFLKVPQPEATKKWYQETLGFQWDEYGTTFYPKHKDNGEAHIAFSFFDPKTSYFDPSTSPIMLNFRVQHLAKMVQDLKEKQVTLLDDIQVFEYGSFVHILDCNQMKIELWEPHEEGFQNAIGAQMP